MTLRFQKFPIYKELRIFVKDMYILSDKLPENQKYELASQLRRAASSSILNLAEGSMKKSDKEFNRFLMISIGSISEAVSILDICLDLKYITSSIHNSYMIKCESVIKQLYGFSKRLKTSQ